MKKLEGWPPPEHWQEVVILWEDMLRIPGRARQILRWIEKTPGGRYHLHGYQSSQGFAFRFENQEDAVRFWLEWS
jgi:hypothetical protein